MNTHPYPSDLNDEEWNVLQLLIFPDRQAGHSQMLELRRIVDAVFSLLRTGCQWRTLPHDFRPWLAVFYHYAEWRRRGTWEQISTSLRKRHRRAHGRTAQPTAAIIDSQSAHTTTADGPRGYDGAKKVSGRKRDILVDTEGILLEACVRPADIHDRRGAESLLAGLSAEFPHIALIWADSAYQGLKAWLAEALGWKLVISKHWWTGLHGIWVAPGQQPPVSQLRSLTPRGFHVLKRRWVVERTLAWFGRNRRMSRDYERLIATIEMLLCACMARVALEQLAQQASESCSTASRNPFQ